MGGQGAHQEVGAAVPRLRERAEHCRRLARNALVDGVARELEAIAQEYERDADRLENAAPRVD